MVDEESHWTDLSVSGEEDHLTIFFSFAPVPLSKPSLASRFDAYPHTRLGTFETEMATHKGLLPGVGSRSRRSHGKRGDCEKTTTEQERIIQFSLATSSCVKSSKV